MTKSINEIILASYLEDEWESWREYCADGAEFFSEPFKDWQRRAVREFAELRSQGQHCRFVAIRFDTFRNWSTLHDHGTNSKARAEFAGTQAALDPIDRKLH